MNDSAPVELRFSREEYAARITRTRRTMTERGLDLLVVCDPSNMAWLTGYDGWSFYVHQCVLLGLEGDPVWFGRAMDANGAKRTVFMSHDDIVGYADHYVQSTERHPMDRLSEVIEERGWGRSRIGVEMDNYYFSAAAHRSLETHLRKATLLDATGLVNWQRLVKSETEIRSMKNAARIVEKMHARILEVVEPGMRKNELVAEIYHAAITGVDGAGGDYPAIVPMLPTGIDASAPHLTWDDKPMRSGEATFFEIAGVYRRYHCPLSRTLFLGRPSARERNAEGALLEAIEAGLDDGEARERVRGHPSRPCGLARPARTGQGRPVRLLHRAQLSAGLGRAHPEPAPGRPHRARAEHDHPLHAGAVVRGLGTRNQREHPHHRDGRGNPRERSPRAAGEAVDGRFPETRDPRRGRGGIACPEWTSSFRAPPAWRKPCRRVGVVGSEWLV